MRGLEHPNALTFAEVFQKPGREVEHRPVRLATAGENALIRNPPLLQFRLSVTRNFYDPIGHDLKVGGENGEHYNPLSRLLE